MGDMTTSQTDSHRFPALLGQGLVATGVLLLPALSLIIDSGYSLGSAVLLLGGLMFGWRGAMQRIGRREAWILVALLGYVLVHLVAQVVHDLSWSDFDRPSRFLLAIPAFLLMLRFPPRVEHFMAGLVAGASMTGLWGLWQKLIEGVPRAMGYTHVIQFGNISMLMGLLCLAGLGWAAMRSQHARVWMGALILGGLLGMLGSLMSGSRGGWVGLPLVALAFYRAYAPYVSRRLQALIVGGGTIMLALILAIPQTGVAQRVGQAVSNVEQYLVEGNANTSVGLRFDMWSAAAQAIPRHPVLGWDREDYMAFEADLIERGDVAPAIANFGHPHNEILNTLLFEGIIGLFGLLLLYGAALWRFLPGIESNDLTRRSMSLCGALLPICFIDFGLSQSFFEHNSGAMVYAFFLVVLAALVRRFE